MKIPSSLRVDLGQQGIEGLIAYFSLRLVVQALGVLPAKRIIAFLIYLFLLITNVHACSLSG
jgi:hypothetical protein